MAASILRRTRIPFFSPTNFSVSLNFSTKSRKPPLDHHTVAQFLTNNHRFSPAAAAQIASRVCLKTLQKADSVISFLKGAGFSNPQLENMFRASPLLLSAHLEANIRPKFQILTNLSFTPVEIAEIVSCNSPILHFSAPRLSSSMASLKGVLGSTAAVTKFIIRPGLYLADTEATLLPNVDFLRSCGVPMKHILRLMNQIPRFFLLKPEEMRRLVARADEMGLDRRSGRFLVAVRVLSSMRDDTWSMKMRALRELGFSDESIARAFKGWTHVLLTSEGKMRRVAEVLVGSGKYDRMSIVATPNVFTFSVEKRIVPRLRVLGALEEKKVITDWPKLSTMIYFSDDMFFERFVRPNLDHVGGLWPLKE